jgi:hypothetical protein
MSATPAPMTAEQAAAMRAELRELLDLCDRAEAGDDQAAAELQVLGAANLALIGEQARQHAWRMIRTDRDDPVSYDAPANPAPT